MQFLKLSLYFHQFFHFSWKVLLILLFFQFEIFTFEPLFLCFYALLCIYALLRTFFSEWKKKSICFTERFAGYRKKEVLRTTKWSAPFYLWKKEADHFAVFFVECIYTRSALHFFLRSILRIRIAFFFLRCAGEKKWSASNGKKGRKKSQRKKETRKWVIADSFWYFEKSENLKKTFLEIFEILEMWFHIHFTTFWKQKPYQRKSLKFMHLLILLLQT